jgi:predicted RNase H-like nuclease (RuvC/YqgF family)
MEPEKVKINCEGCNKDFSASYIQKHKTKCKNEKIFKCEFCSKKLSTKNNLNEHLKICKEKIYALYSNLENENNQIKSQYEDKINQMQDEITLLKSTIHELEMKNREYEIQQKYINQSKEEYRELIGKVSTTINNTYSNTSNNNITLKQIVSKLEPICYDDIKNSMNLFTNEYLDDGIMGFARFLCEHSCNNKIITSDKSRNTIAYRTKFNDFIKDP